jgi:CBS domain-containing protein/Zn-dependent protease
LLGKHFSIKVHYSWILVFVLVTAIVATQFSEYYALWQKIALGVIVALLFLLSAAIREIILAIATVHKDNSVKKIMLFAFGGVYQENRERISSPHWLLIYLARLSINLVIVVLFYGLYATFINAGSMAIAGVAQWLAYIYALLFLLHLVPAFPLDGGEILRMFLWKSTGDYYKATHFASLIGRVTGLFLVFAGVLVFIFTKQWAICLVIILTGWILQIAAGDTRRKVKMLMLLQPIKAQDIITREYLILPRLENIGHLIKEYILVKGGHFILVVDDAKLKGILTLGQIKSVPGNRRDNTTIGDIMTPYEHLVTADPQQSAAAILEQMDQRNTDIIPVLEDEKILGVVTRQALMSLVKTRTGFLT